MNGPEWIGRERCAAARRRGAGVAAASALILILASIVMDSGVRAASGATAGDIDALLRRADSIKTSDHAAFISILGRLRSGGSRLSGQQSLYVRYLEAWEDAYAGSYARGIVELEAISRGSGYATLRFRAGVTAVNALVIARRYEEAYVRLATALDRLPQVADPDARLQGLAVAAFVYDEAGQYDLAIEYADRLLAEPLGPTAPCKGTYLKLDARMHMDDGRVAEDELRRGIALCEAAREPVWTDLIIALFADAWTEHGRSHEAIELLRAHYSEAQRTDYARLRSEFDAILGKAYWASGDATRAAAHARGAIGKAVNGAITKPLVDAYRILYESAEKQGDFRRALDYHEKYAAADKGYLDDSTARSLAYQMVSQQVLDDTRRIDALNEKNAVLRLRREVARKASEAERLYLGLLGLGLAFAGVWAWRTKRSQIYFLAQSRRDGLTGILNRQQFMDEAQVLLRQCAKASRDGCLILIDLDNFKTINDSHGHAAGDGVLQQAVITCLRHLRPADLFGRVGGEEFGVLLPDCLLDSATQRAEALRAAIAASAGQKIRAVVSASFGVASARESGHDLRRMFIDADSALYRAKRGGRNRVESGRHASIIAEPV